MMVLLVPKDDHRDEVVQPALADPDPGVSDSTDI